MPERIQVMDIHEMTIHEDFPAGTFEMGVGFKIYTKGYYLFTTSPIPEEKLSLIRLAIEKILNNEP